MNLVLPVDELIEAVVAMIWETKATPMGLKICEQSLADSPVDLGSTPEEVAAKFPAVYVSSPDGWREGETDSPQRGMGGTILSLRLTYLQQYPLDAAPGDTARSCWQAGSQLAEVFADPEFRFPGSITLPDLVIFRRCKPVGIQAYSAAELIDLGTRICGCDVDLSLQFATFG